MTDPEPQFCQYQIPRTRALYPCVREAARNGHCLAHTEDRTPEEDRQFEELVRRQLEEEQGCDFNGFVFHDGFTFREGHEGFDRYEFPAGKGADFSHAHFKGDADFFSVRIGGDADFRSATIDGSADFRSVTTDGDADFRSATIGGYASFEFAEIGRDAVFDSATIHDNMILFGAAIGGDAMFRSSTIGGHMDLELTTIGGDADFGWARIDGYASFGTTTIHGCARFEGARAAGADFSDARISRTWAASACRFAKQANQNIGEYLEAGDYHYLERCHAWAAKLFNADPPLAAILSALNPFTWLEYLFARLVFGYGERPLRPVFWAIVIVLACAIGYINLGVGAVTLCDGTPLHSLRDAVYFSTVTFTTLGFGDYRPCTQAARILAGLEAFTGALTMALFAVTLAKRYGRG